MAVGKLVVCCRTVITGSHDNRLHPIWHDTIRSSSSAFNSSPSWHSTIRPSSSTYRWISRWHGTHSDKVRFA